jgi:hypothetical protein
MPEISTVVDAATVKFEDNVLKAGKIEALKTDENDTTRRLAPSGVDGGVEWVPDIPGSAFGTVVDASVSTPTDSPVLILTHTTTLDDATTLLMLDIFGHGANGETPSYTLRITAKRDSSSVVTIEDIDIIHEFNDGAGLPTAVVVGSDIQVKVTGILAVPVTWRVGGNVAERQF